jgi:hypothetical protein
MPTLQFPTLSDRTNVHNLINDYAHGKCSRNDLMRWVANIIEKYNIKRMPIFNYSVRILTYYGDLPIISIEGPLSDHCPTCGAGIGATQYLRTEQENLSEDYDIASFTCLECGCVYTSKVDNGKKSVVYE